MFATSTFTVNEDFEHKIGAEPAGVQIDFFMTIRMRLLRIEGLSQYPHMALLSVRSRRFEFLGETFQIPDNFERHLDENYGNWRSPAIFYDLSYDDSA